MVLGKPGYSELYWPDILVAPKIFEKYPDHGKISPLVERAGGIFPRICLVALELGRATNPRCALTERCKNKQTNKQTLNYCTKKGAPLWMPQ